MSLLLNLAHAAPTILASFLASFVEFIEALTVVLAVGIVRGWRAAIAGTVSALALLAGMVLAFGRSLAEMPLPTIQLVVGTLLLLFGLRWLRKAILRSAGVIALHDEVATYAKETAQLHQSLPDVQGAWDKVAFLTAFKIVMLEGIEVVFIVIAIGASGQLIVPASVGAIAALVLVVLLGLWLHRPLGNIPENALKFCVGILLAAFGTFWVGEGVHIEWPGADWAIVALIVGYFIFAHVLLMICKAQPRADTPAVKKVKKASPTGWLQTIWHELVGLFVDDGMLAAGILIWVIAAWGAASRVNVSMTTDSVVFFIGFVLMLGMSAVRAARS
ncbi:hypothetical protein hmeg3_11940 [Herbaspirillum sp. meg3]|nr:hypothetical protein hmeg3_11940 [Herbaspirillum sp. meg3]